jgi:UDP-2-acetamido-2-deoxy-ribo-hexuluronate aminotransferase
VDAHNTSSYAQYTVRLENREAVQARMNAVRIPTAIHYPIPLNRQPAVADCNVRVPVGDEIAGKVMSLPMHPYLEFVQQEQVVVALIDTDFGSGDPVRDNRIAQQLASK